MWGWGSRGDSDREIVERGYLAAEVVEKVGRSGKVVEVIGGAARRGEQRHEEGDDRAGGGDGSPLTVKKGDAIRPIAHVEGGVRRESTREGHTQGTGGRGPDGREWNS